MQETGLFAAIAVAADRVPPGAWAVGVSGGADSIALLHVLKSRNDLRLIVVHLNHELRGEESEEDEGFVGRAAQALGLPFESARASVLRSSLQPDVALPENPSARFRRMRFILLANVVRAHQLQGVILAHHADDQAETVFHRLLRGSSYAGLAGMSRDAHVGGVRVLRPLLGVRCELLRRYLREHGVAWREDSSNRSGKYMRNRIRALLRDRDDLHRPLIELADRCRALREQVHEASPRLGANFPVRRLADLPRLVARRAATGWLCDRGVPMNLITPSVVQRLLTMCADAASPARAHFPGNLVVCRRAGRITAEL